MDTCCINRTVIRDFLILTGQTSNSLLETNVTVINNDDCTNWLRGNASEKADIETQLKNALFKGVNDEILCTTGFYNETTNAYSVSRISGFL